MKQSLRETVSLLSCTPATLNALLRPLSEAWTLQDEGENTWTAVDVIGHLIYADREDWLPRARTIMQFGESQPFEPFDRLGYKQESQGKSLAFLLDEFARVRAESLHQLRSLNLQTDDFALRGRHPSFGVVTLSELLATWAVHDLTHLHQIVRIMASQYREAVGPWSTYLGVLQCAGHSASA